MPQQQQQTQGRERDVRERPVHVVRYGNIKGAVWRNMVDHGNASRPMYNVTFARSYKDNDQWRDSSSFGVDDLLTVAKVADACHSWIHAERSREAQDPT